MFCYFVQTLERDLCDMVGERLHEMAWNGCYPINHSVALWAFFEAFQKGDSLVESSSLERLAQIVLTVRFHKEVFSLETSIDFDEILAGDASEPEGSPACLDAVAKRIYDQLFESLPSGLQRPEFRREVEGERGIQNRLKDELSVYFARFHENLLLPVNGGIPTLREPKLFYEVLSGFPMGVYSDSLLLSSDDPPDSPTPRELLDKDIWDEFDSDYFFPSARCMERYFWGLYLSKLQVAKGYSLRRGVNDPLAAFLEEGERALRYEAVPRRRSERL